MTVQGTGEKGTTTVQTRACDLGRRKGSIRAKCAVQGQGYARGRGAEIKEE